VALCLAAGALLIAQPAAAQTAQPPAQQSDEQLKKLVAEADAALDAKQYPIALEKYTQAAAGFQARQDAAALANAQLGQCNALIGLNRKDEALKLALEVRAAAIARGDRFSEARTYNMELIAETGEPTPQLLENVKKAAAIFRDVGDRGREKTSLDLLLNALMSVSRFEEGYPYAQRGVEIFTAPEDATMRAYALYFLAEAETKRGDPAALGHAREALQLAESLKLDASLIQATAYDLAMNYYTARDFRSAVTYFQQSIEAGDTGRPRKRYLAYVWLSSAYGQLGEKDRELETARAEWQFAEKSYPSSAPVAHAAYASLLAGNGRFDQAMAEFSAIYSHPTPADEQESVDWFVEDVATDLRDRGDRVKMVEVYEFLLSHDTTPDRRRLRVLAALAEEALLAHKYDHARQLLLEQAALSKTLKVPFQQKYALEALARAAQGEQKRDEAISYSRQAALIKLSLTHVAALITKVEPGPDGVPLAYLDRTPEDGILPGERGTVIACDTDEKRDGRRLGTAEIVEVQEGMLAARVTLFDPKKDHFQAGDFVDAPAMLPTNPDPSPLLRTMQNGLTLLSEKTQEPFVEFRELAGNDSEPVLREIYGRMIQDLHDTESSNLSLQWRADLKKTIAEGRYASRTRHEVLSTATEADLLAFLYYLAEYPSEYRGSYKLWKVFQAWAADGATPAVEELVNGVLASRSDDEQRAYLAHFQDALQGGEALDHWRDSINHLISLRRFEQAERLARLIPVLAGFIKNASTRTYADGLGHLLLAEVLIHEKKHNEAVSEYILAAAAWQGEAQQRNAAVVAHDLGKEYTRLGRYKEALQQYELSVRSDEQYYAKHPQAYDRHSLASKLWSLALAYYKLSRYDEALPVFERALEIYIQTPGPAAVNAHAQITDKLGDIYSKRGEYKKSIQFYEQARALRAKLNEPAKEALSLVNIGTGYWSLGEYARALGYFEKSLFLSETVDDRSSAALALQNIGGLNSNLGNFEAAQKSYNDAIAIYGDLHSDEEQSDVYVKMGQLQRQTGHFAEAAKFLGLALTLREKLAAPDLLFDVYNNLGLVHFDQKNYLEAEKEFQRAYTIQTDLGNRSEQARALEYLSAAHFWLHDITRSSKEARQALALWQEIGDAEGIIRALESVGYRYKYQGEWDKAKQHFQQAVDLAHKTESKSLEADSQSALADVLWSQGQTHAALEDYRGILAVYESLGDLPKQAATRNNLGFLLRSRGEYAAAEKEFHAALDLSQKTGDRIQEANARTGLCFLAADRGDITGAKQIQESVLKLYEETQNPFGQAYAITTLGQINRYTGHLREALANALDALARYQTLQSPIDEAKAHIDVARVYESLRNYPEALQHVNNALSMEENRFHSPFLREGALEALGTVYAKLHNYEESLKAYGQAEKIAAELNLANDVIGFKVEEAEVYRTKGDYPVAQKLLAEALEARTRLGTDLDTSDIHDELGKVAYRTKDYTAAARELDAALAGWERQDARSSLWETLYYRGLVERALNNPAAAIRDWKRAVDVVESMRSQIESESAKTMFQSDKNDLYADLVDLLLKSSNCQECEDLAWQYIGRSKSAELASLFGNSFKRARTAEERAIVEQADTFQTRELALRRQLDEARHKPEAERDQASIDRFSAELKIVLTEYDTYVNHLTEEQKKLVQIQPDSFRQVQASLATGEVFLEPMVLPDRIVIFVVRWGVNVPLLRRESERVSEAEVNATIERLRVALSPESHEAESGEPLTVEARERAIQRVLPDLQKLYNWMIKPVLAEVQDAGTLIISPSGRLRYVPFSALHDGSQYLVERYQTVLLTQAGAITAAREHLLRMDDARMLAISNPDPVNQPLPGADQEVARLSLLLDGSGPAAGSAKHVLVLSHSDASKKKVLDMLYDYQILHMATHGHLDNKLPEQSYLLLAGGQDSHLTFGEIGRLEVGQTRLVTLSACETAVGEHGEGREIAGLAYSFERAGASTVIATLWEVEDESTSQLMIEFYSRLKAGQSVGQAMQGAQKTLLANPSYRDPYYWAPFLVIGSWR
jgi:CHAT domain-containing protein/Tfp pilus assembly protein PilF